MSIWKLANNYGYTLMELILAMAIVSLISAVALPNYTRYIEDTREKVCTMNRQTILYEYHLYCLSEKEITLSDYLNTYYTQANDTLCPSGGIYTASGSGENAKLICSKHFNMITDAQKEPIPAFLDPVPIPFVFISIHNLTYP